MPQTKRLKILVLAGTREARELTDRLAGDPRYEVVASYAGAIAQPTPLAVPTRMGGFGGPAGLAQYLQAAGIDVVVDATHPFAARMSANAAAACDLRRTPLYRLEREGWQAEPGDTWIDVPDVRRAAEALPDGARAFLAVGRKELGAFTGREDVTFTMRMIDPPAPDEPVPPGEIIRSFPQESVDAERSLFAAHDISHLVTKNSGGAAGRAKLLAARTLKLPVVMVARPATGAGPRPVRRVSDALRLLEELWCRQ